ncbi:MAG: IS1182 family transposase [Bacillota bacterium]|nr:IS1182 family transposase [Bacillota bacterium]
MMGYRRFAPKLYYQLSLDRLVPQNHLLRRIAEVIDFSFVYPLARPYYSHTGQPSVDPVVLFKALLIGYLYGITSERRLMEEIQVNLAYRWFLGYDLDEAIPDHSVLSKARVRFGMEVFEAFFNRSVELCQAAGLVRGEAAFLDSILMQANAALASLESTDGHQPPMPARRYVEQLFAENPVRPEEPSPTTPSGSSDKKPTEAEQRAEPKAQRPPLNQRARSRTDPEASVIHHPTFGLHLAYKAHMAVDDHPARVITAAVVTPGATADEYLLEELLWRHRRQVGRLPRDVVADRRYGTLHHYRYLAELRIRAAIAHRAGKKRNAGGVWNIQDFRYDAGSDTYTCPAGQTLDRRMVRPSNRTIVYRAPLGVCRTCRFRSQCSPGGKERGLSRSFDRGFLEEAQRWLATEEGKRKLRQRKVYVETVFAIAKDRHGLRRAQWRGKWKVQIQVWLTAAAMNIKKLARITAAAGGASAGAIRAFSRRLIWRPRNRLPCLFRVLSAAE